MHEAGTDVSGLVEVIQLYVNKQEKAGGCISAVVGRQQPVCLKGDPLVVSECAATYKRFFNFHSRKEILEAVGDCL